MANGLSEISVGFDLRQGYSQLTYCHQNSVEPSTIGMLQTPRDLFSLIEQRAELGIALLSNFFKESLDKIKVVGQIKQMRITVTVAKLSTVWAKAIIQALEMLEVPRGRIYLQDYKESFYHYMLNQKRDLWRYKAVLFEYDKDEIAAYEFQVSFGTKPALGTVNKLTRLYLDHKTKEEYSGADWNSTRDELFLAQVKEVMTGENYSSVYLIGEAFDKEWMQRSLQFLCKKSHVFQGNNLYTKGACYASMEQGQPAGKEKFLYNGPDMIEHNIGMQMRTRAGEHYHNMVTAGVHYCMGDYSCEFLLEDTQHVVLIAKSVRGAEAAYTIELTGLPKRPAKGTRIRMELDFLSKDKCKAKIDDLGMGELCPSSGKKWEAVIELQ